MKIKYNTQGRILELYITVSEEFIPYLQEGEAILEVDLSTTFDTLSYYVQNNELIAIPPKPEIYSEFNWDTKIWELPTNTMQVARSDFKKIINSLAGEVILEKYPIYRQINYNRDIESTLAIEMNSWIDAIRAESNLAVSRVENALTLEALEVIITDFKTYLESL